MIRKKVYLILHNIRSAHNVGSIFRTADGAGVAKLYLTGYTPAPTDKFGRINKEIAKTALGAEKVLPWEKVKIVNTVIKKLKTQKFKIICVEQAKNSVDYKKFSAKSRQPLALILGSEVGGLPKDILKISDQIIEIPMRGKKESLNVSVAAGIVLFQLIKN